MPKAKKVPKTEKMWMGWHEFNGFEPWNFGLTACGHKVLGQVPVRIMPEAEYQRLRKAAKGED